MNKKIITALFMLLVLMMPQGSFAATHDATEDISSDTATLYLGKVLTVSQDNKFPDLTDFRFEIEAVKAWDNANVDGSLSGKDISPSDMPKPAASGSDHHTISTTGNKTTVSVGDFTGQANTTKADTSKEKFRVTPVNITFDKAGYYLYKISETQSVPANVPGVSYDDSSYYAAIYVCNKTDEEGNTIEGVYVHDITSFRNSPGTDKKPDFTDIQNITDNNGTPAAENTIENFEKTGKSNPTPGPDPGTGLLGGPDKLEAYKFWNDVFTRDVVITNNVTGNLGDITKEFEMTVTLSGLEPSKTYTTDIPAEYKTEKKETSAGADLVSATVGTVNTSAKTFTTDANGKAEFMIKLKDDEVFVMNALPDGATYKADEHASDHIASYSISSTSNSAVIANDSDANNVDQTALATQNETVNGPVTRGVTASAATDDQTVTIAYVNHRNLATVTGIPYYGDFAYVVALALILGLAAVVIRRRSQLR